MQKQQESTEETEGKWSEEEELAEVERREREIESGRVQPITDAEFWKRVESGRTR